MVENKKQTLLVNRSIVDNYGFKKDTCEIVDVSMEMIKRKIKNLNGYEFVKIEDVTKKRSY